MAGHGPTSQDQRRRRNPPARGEWTELPSEPYGGPRPSLKTAPITGRLSVSTKKAWETWWSSPMAHMWGEHRWDELLQLVALTELITRMMRSHDHRGVTSLLSEQRQRKDSLGLTEKGMRDLRWKGPSEGAAETTPPASGRRAHLRVV